MAPSDSESVEKVKALQLVTGDHIYIYIRALEEPIIQTRCNYSELIQATFGFALKYINQGGRFSPVIYFEGIFSLSKAVKCIIFCCCIWRSYGNWCL